MQRWPAFDINGGPAYTLAMSTGHVLRFVVFGSFVTAKPGPGDIDIFLIMARLKRIRRIIDYRREAISLKSIA